MSSINRQQIADGVYFSCVRDSRFKTMKLSVNLLVPLSADTASEYALLADVLTRSCKAYPDFTALSRKLCALYGADLSVNVSKMGECQLISLAAAGLDDRYALDDDSIAAELSSLLCGVIFEPNIVDGAFVPSEVEQERRQLLDTIDAEYSEKRVYAIGKLVELMCGDERFGIRRYGTVENIKAATPQSLVQAWKNLLKTAVIEIIYIGDTQPDKAVEVFRTTLGAMDRQPAALHTEIIREAGEVRRCTEEADVSQAKLVMGFRAGAALPEETIWAEVLMSAVLGGTATSKLFCNVREKQSLCYYCASRYDKRKGILLVDSGVEPQNIEKLERGIMKEIEDIQNGVISDFEMESAKKALTNVYQSSNDSVSGIEAWVGSQLLTDYLTIEEVVAKTNAVTKEEVVEAAKRLQLDTVYVLKNKGGEQS